jgi:UDP-glucose 4-epimerase
MTVLVTGGAGFIGTNLCEHLIARGHDVEVLDDFSTGYRSNLEHLDVRLHEGSILDESLVSTAVDGAEAVVHLAARGSVPRSVADPGLTNDINVNGTLRVLTAARDVGAHFVFASSSSVYGANETLPKEEALTPLPKSPYAASKLAAESYTNAFQRTYGMSGLAFRFFNVFGPLQSARHPYAAVVPTFISALMDGKPIEVHGDGLQSRDFTAVDTVVEVLAEAVEKKVSVDVPVNLAFGTNTNLLQLIDHLCDLMGVVNPVVDFTDARSGDVRSSSADNSRLRQLFPTIEPVPLDVGLERTIDWFRRTGGEQT